MDDTRAGRPEQVNRTIVAAMFALAVTILFAAMAWPAGRFVLVVMAPGDSPQAVLSVISRSGGTLVDSTRFDWMAVAYSDEDQFARRLKDAGALLVVNHLLVAGCRARSQT